MFQKLLIDHVDVEIGSGALLAEDDNVLPSDVVFRVPLTGPAFVKLAKLNDLKEMSPIDRSTVARLVGQELPREW